MNPNEQTLIKVHNVSRYYDKLCAVDQLSFEVKRGEVVGLLGPNGAGKSTTLKMLSGNLAPSNGEIIVNQYDLFDQPKQAKKELGYLPDIPPLYSEFTVKEYLAFCAQLNRISKPMQASAIQSAMERCGLISVANKLIHNLSKGFQQRVGIAQAVIHSPQVIILDEPTVGLDPIQIREIRSLIRELRNDHSIILSTHILPEVTATCDRVLIINQGKIVLQESTETLKHRMDSSSLLLGMHNPPPITELYEIDGITHVEKAGQDKIRVHHNIDCNPAELIIQTAVNKNWRLYEVTPERLTLEDIFVNFTTQESNSDLQEDVVQ
jgi:ABC-2 type transport system ATP-binding protein